MKRAPGADAGAGGAAVGDLARRERELSALGEIVALLTRTSELQAALRGVGAVLATVLPGGSFGAVLVDGEDLTHLPLAPPAEPARMSRSSQHGSPLGIALFERRTVHVPGAAGDPLFERAGRWLVTPVLSGERVLGALLAGADAPAAFDAGHADVLSQAAIHVGVALEHARMHDDMMRHARQVGTLREVVESISSELDLERLLQRIVAAAVELLGAYGGAVGLARPDGDALEIAALVNIPEEIGTLIPVGTGVMGLSLAELGPVVAHDYADLPAPIPLEALYQLAPWIAVPILWQDGVTGVFGICAADPTRRFSDADVELITLFAKHAGIAIENARLYQRSRELAITEERNRLAREIHDTLAQSLTGMVLQIEAVEDLLGERPEQAREELQSLKHLARASLEEARRSVWGLRPPVLEAASLMEAVEQLLRDESRAGAFSGRFSTAGRARPLTPAIEAGVYRIAQEALTNVRRHAQARAAVVQVRFDVGDLVLIVQDDGRGLGADAPAEGGGFGLTSMQERARLLGGAMRLESEPGSGTRVEVHVPYLASSVAASPVAPGATHGPHDWPVRVLVADDNEVARHGIVRMLETHADIVVVGEAATGDEALVRVRQLRPDIILVDLQMPGMDGIELMEAIGREKLEARPIILTTFARDDLIMDGIRAGARGFLLKDITADELAGAVRAVSRGGSLLQPVVATRLVEQIGRLARSESGREQLTPRELDVLKLLVEGARNKEISAQLHISHGTVRFHVGNIFQKLGVSSRTEAVRLALQEGLVS